MTDKEQMHIFAKNMRYQIEKTGKMQKVIAKELGVTPTTLNNWCREVSMPKAGKLQYIADYFGIGKTALLDDVNFATGQADARILAKIHLLNEANRQVLIATLDALIESQRNSSDNNP